MLWEFYLLCVEHLLELPFRKLCIAIKKDGWLYKHCPGHGKRASLLTLSLVLHSKLALGPALPHGFPFLIQHVDITFFLCRNNHLFPITQSNIALSIS